MKLDVIIDFLWWTHGEVLEEDELRKEYLLEDIQKWKNQGWLKPHTPKPESKETVIDLDVNNDGVVDKEDFKEIASALGKRGAKKRKANKKSGKKVK